jgi:predicted amidohydrolase
MGKLGICVLSVATGQGNTNREIDANIATIRSAMKDIDAWVTGQGDTIEKGNAFHAIFVAPEYYFVAKHPSKRLPLTKAQKDDIEARLLQISRDYPKVVMVPGSIFYEEALTEQKVVQAKSNALAAEFAARLRANPAARGSQVRPSALHPNRVPQSNDLNIVDTMNLPGETAREQEMRALELGDQTDGYWGRKKGLINVITGLKAGDTRARNRAYIMLNGERVGMYDKHSDFFETGKAPDNCVFIPGTNEQCPEIGGFRFGVEICADHRLGVIRNRGVADLDFHVVLSDFIDPHAGNVCVRTGGCYIHASSNLGASSAYVKTDTGYQKLIGFAGKGAAMTPVYSGELVDIEHRT